MKKYNFTGELKIYIDKALNGTSTDVDFLFDKLHTNSTLAMTRFIDYSLSLVENSEGVERIRYYLFKGTLIQRNYASLYFNRIDDWKCVKEAYKLGLIDEIQAYAR